MERLASPYQETLDARTAFTKTITVTATRGETQAVLTALAGSFTQDARRSLRWNGSLTVAVTDDLIPTTPADLLTPFGTTIEIALGVMLADGSSDQVPYGTYDLEKSRVVLSADSRVVEMELVDLGQRLARYRFEKPYTIPPSTDLADAVNLVVNNRLALNLQLGDSGTVLARKRVFGLDPGLDPAREIIELAEGFGYRIWFDRNANVVLDRPPLPQIVDAIPFEGEMTVAGNWESKPPNVIVARGEATTGAPVQAVAYDLDPLSPTYAGNSPGSTPYGRVTHYLASPLITTSGQAVQAANSNLATHAAQGAAWDVTKAYDPSVDCDDVLLIPLGDEEVALFVQAVTLNLDGQTVINCRALSNLVE